MTDSNGAYRPIRYRETREPRLNRKAINAASYIHMLAGIASICFGIYLVVRVGFESYWLNGTVSCIWVGLYILLIAALDLVAYHHALKKSIVILSLIANMFGIGATCLCGVLCIINLSKVYGCFTRDEEKMQHHFCSLNATKIFGVYGAEIALMGLEFLICVMTSYQICISKCGGSIRGRIMYQGSDYDVYSSSSEPFAQARLPVRGNDVEDFHGQEMTSPVYNEPPPPYTEK